MPTGEQGVKVHQVHPSTRSQPKAVTEREDPK